MSVKFASPEPVNRETSITARAIRVISVSMSISEMNQLIDSFGRTEDELSSVQRAVQREFTQAVEQLQ